MVQRAIIFLFDALLDKQIYLFREEKSEGALKIKTAVVCPQLWLVNI